MASSATIHKLQDEIRQEIEKASAEAEEHKRLAKGYEESATEAALRLEEEGGVELNLPEKDKLLQMEGDGHFFPQAEFPHFFNEPYFWKVKAEKQFHEGQNSDDEESDPHKLMKRLEEVRKAQLESKIELAKQNTTISQLRQRKFELGLQKEHRDKIVQEKQKVFKAQAMEIAKIRDRENDIRAEIEARTNVTGELERQKLELDYKRKKKDEYLYDLEQSALALEAQCLDVKDMNHFIRNEEDLLVRQAKHLREQQQELQAHRRTQPSKKVTLAKQQRASALHNVGAH
mmetsp:Transcript_25214/g.59782  ORF Transcript_25214/g.59782 Transcript_25214/m.59782 type:complete len:288 (+) Transcript_25214:21-884(+)